MQGAAKIKNTDALKENDELLEWLLKELFKIGRHPHPHSRQVWKYCLANINLMLNALGF